MVVIKLIWGLSDLVIPIFSCYDSKWPTSWPNLSNRRLRNLRFDPLFGPACSLYATNIKKKPYRGGNKGLYVVARNFFLLLLNCSAWPCLGPAYQNKQTFISPSVFMIQNFWESPQHLSRRQPRPSEGQPVALMPIPDPELNEPGPVATLFLQG